MVSMLLLRSRRLLVSPGGAEEEDEGRRKEAVTRKSKTASEVLAGSCPHRVFVGVQSRWQSWAK